MGERGVGVIIDGAGIGSSMTANKFPGVRAALCYDFSSARNSREHNNANVLTLGASLIGGGLAKQIVDTFLDTQCTAERHLRRAAMIDEIDSQFRTGVGLGKPTLSVAAVPRGSTQRTEPTAVRRRKRQQNHRRWRVP